MPGMTEALAALHRLHLDLQQVHEELARGPRQIKVREQKIAATWDAAARLKEELKQTRAAADRKSLDLKGREAKIADLRVKLNACSSNREYDILRGQIEADEVASSVLEDEILELLEKVDRLQREIAETEAKARQLQRECDEFAAAFARSAEGLHQQAADLQARIRDAERILTGETADRYRRLIEAHGADGMASVDRHGVCSSCFVALTPQGRVLVGTGEVVFCPSCGRLLYSIQEG
jgi:predicted  nucleic acid-binding Zn-ribbon protein